MSLWNWEEREGGGSNVEPKAVGGGRRAGGERVKHSLPGQAPIINATGAPDSVNLFRYGLFASQVVSNVSAC